MTRDEYEHLRVAAFDGEETYDAALERMTRSRDVYGVPFHYYRRAQLYKFSEKSILGRGEMLQKLAEDDERYYGEVCAATGRTREQVRQDLAVFNDNPYAKVSISQYAQLGLYRPDAAAKSILTDLRDRAALHKRLALALERIDKGEDSYSSISVDLEKYYQITERTLLPSDIEEVRETIEKSNPDILKDEKLLRKTVADMVVCNRLMGFWDFEYFMFGFPGKSLQERRTFVSNDYRTYKLKLVNNRRKGEVFDNKARTYELLKEYYGRSVIAVNSEDDFENFAEFCKGRSGFVKKPMNEAMGHGIGFVKINEGEDLRELFASVYDEIGPFICEERIEAHPAISALNPDSVNTVRVSTYHDGNMVHILWPFMKIGRSGSFVDNGGAGGILVAIDEHTGKFISDGIDESCNRYKTHPDNGIAFQGYQLPDWASALELGRIIGMKAKEIIPEVAFIGWDFTYTGDNQWIVVEGNAMTQLIGQQAPLDNGIRAELDQMIPG